MPTHPDKPIRRRRQTPWAAMLLIAFLVAAYIGAYFALSTYEPPLRGVPAYRAVEYDWMVTVYEPLRIIESDMRGTEVRLITWWPYPLEMRIR